MSASRVERYGSDVVAELLLDAGVPFVAYNPGASIRGLEDSLHAYGPQPILCLHEEICVAVAHGYAKAAGRPMAAALHDVVGLQHASMAIFNAWCDRAPVLLLGGTGPVSKTERRPWIEWIHTALTQGEQVRNYVKWDDQPSDLSSLPEAFARGWQALNAVPRGPVYLCVDAAIQEQRLLPGLTVVGASRYPSPTAPSAPAAEVARLAGELTAARSPLLVTDYAGETETGYAALRRLAELLGAPVLDRGARANFPSTHELNVTGMHESTLAAADLIVALDVEDLVGALGTTLADRATGRLRPGVRVINVSPAHLKLRAWSQDYQQTLPVTRHLTAACETLLPDLVDACRRLAPVAEAGPRRARLSAESAQRRARWRAHAAAADGDGAIAVARLALALGERLAGRRWTLVAGRLDGWEGRLWEFDRPRQHLGWHGGAGMGYSAGAAIGAALALGPETLAVCVQSDGDLMYTPGALWTAARYRLPVLFVMKNNRQYQNTVHHAFRVARARNRADAHLRLAPDLVDPAIDFAALATSMGVWGTGPVTEPDTLGPALDAALSVVVGGRPALVDVVTAVGDFVD
jgi:acetolactate synthase-1/2/3 large subunit